MICISNGLIPDLGGLAEENSGAENAAGNVSSSAEPVVQFSYDNTLEEIDGAMKSFQAPVQEQARDLFYRCLLAYNCGGDRFYRYKPDFGFCVCRAAFLCSRSDIQHH